MRNTMVQDRILRERAHFVESIDQAAILALASSHHQNAPCRFFRALKHGGFNVCFFVEFDSPDTHTQKHRWVVRVPIPGRTPVAWIDEKLEVEVATMRLVEHLGPWIGCKILISDNQWTRYVAFHTQIPVPNIHAYSFSGESPIGMAFIIMDFVDGQNLMEHGFKSDDKWANWRIGAATEATKRVYQQLAEVFIELRQQEFPKIGALGFDVRGPSESNPAGVHVCHRPLSIEIAMQECEGQNPAEIFQINKTFNTSSEYIQSLLWLLDNELDRSTNPDIDMVSDGGSMLLYAAHDFRHFVTEEWLDASKENGPFVLMHGDLHNHYSNLLWDDNLNLVGVIDWEWSQVVPLQLLTPPIWLENTTVESLGIFQGGFQKEVGYLLEALRRVEEAHGGPQTLSKEWAKMEKWCHPLVVSALFSPNDIYDVYWGPVSKHRFEFDEPQARAEAAAKAVGAFQRSETVQAWMMEKRVVQDRYYEEEDAYVYLEEEEDNQNEKREAN